MITVTRFNKTRFVINSDWIETVESTPDTVITLTNGKKFVVSESLDDIVKQITEYRQKTFCLNRAMIDTGEAK